MRSVGLNSHALIRGMRKRMRGTVALWAAWITPAYLLLGAPGTVARRRRSSPRQGFDVR